MVEITTKPTKVATLSFIETVTNKQRREDALVLLSLFNRVTGQQPVIWGTSIIGYGAYTYTLANGKQNQFMRCGFSPRKQNLSIYVGAGMSKHPELLNQLGKHKRSKACLYINKLTDVDLDVLEQLIVADLHAMHERYPE